MTTAAFSTPIALYGPFRAPRQMLANQEYGGHVSLHDDAMAKKLGFAAGPIEGPTHFSQFVPLLERLWGREWFETGCLSIHFKSPCVEGDEVARGSRLAGNGANASGRCAAGDGAPAIRSGSAWRSATAPRC